MDCRRVALHWGGRIIVFVVVDIVVGAVGSGVAWWGEVLCIVDVLLLLLLLLLIIVIPIAHWCVIRPTMGPRAGRR